MADLSANFNVDYPGAMPPGAWAQYQGSLPGYWDTTYTTKPASADVLNGPAGTTQTATNVPAVKTTSFQEAFLLPTDTMKASNYQGGLSFSPMSFQKGTNGGMTTTGGFQFDLPMATIAAFQNNALTFTAANAEMNRSFLTGVINTQTAAVQNTAQLSGGLSRQAIGAGKDIASMNNASIVTVANNALDYGKYAQAQQTDRTRIQTEGANQGGGGGCFFTTAVCEHWGLSDKCDILETMRAFRDDVMMVDPELMPLVKEYYERAPEIVEKINARPDASAIWEYVGNFYIIPGVNLCKVGAHKMALMMYRKMCEYLDKLTGA